MGNRQRQGPATHAVRLVEIGYQLAGADRDWLTRLLPIFEAAVGSDLGVIGLVERPGQAPLIEATERGTPLVDAMLKNVAELVALDPRSYERLRLGVNDFTSGNENSLSQLGIPLEQQPGFIHARNAGVEDNLVLRARDPWGTLFLVAPYRHLVKPRVRERRIWSRAASHLAAALRLRSHASETEEVAAVFDPKGIPAHLTEAAEKRRTALRETVLAAERSRDPNEEEKGAALDARTALTSGQWSLVEWFDSDGKRFYVARANAPEVPQVASLTVRETQVATYLALGGSLKVIAYDLGLSIATVARAGDSAVRKLGLKSRLELAGHLGPLLSGNTPQS